MSFVRTRVKICGITNVGDALASVDAGADALGFICVPGSPRFVPDSEHLGLTRCVPPLVTRVGVYADLTLVRDIWQTSFDAIQFYAMQQPHNIRPRLIRAYRIKDVTSLDDIAQTLHEASALVLDGYHPSMLGGTGETFNWDLAIEAKERFGRPIILAGGLTPDNVGEAVQKVRPYAVDVSSGVEASPGRKDHAKVRDFIQAVRSADAAIAADE